MVPYTTYPIPHTTYHIPHTTYHVPHTIYHIIPYTLYHIPHTTYHIPYTCFRIPGYIWNSQYLQESHLYSGCSHRWGICTTHPLYHSYHTYTTYHTYHRPHIPYTIYHIPHIPYPTYVGMGGVFDSISYSIPHIWVRTSHIHPHPTIQPYTHIYIPHIITKHIHTYIENNTYNTHSLNGSTYNHKLWYTTSYMV